MLSNPSQYLPQGWGPQFPIQGFGAPQMSVGPFGQVNPFGVNTTLGYDSSQVGAAQQQHPFGGQLNPLAQNPFGQQLTQNPFAAFATNPYVQNQLWANPFIQNPFLNSVGHIGAHPVAQQIVPALGQLAQQIAVQSAVTQQIGAALHQLAQQLVLQGSQTQQGFGLGGAQPFAGMNPQAQAWGPNRQPTIQ